MKHCHLILGGASFFLAPRVKFFENPVFQENASSFTFETIDWSRISDCTPTKPKGDVICIFGVKRWTRKLIKARMSSDKAAKRVSRFISKSFGEQIPIVLVEDLDLKNSRSVGRAVIDDVVENFNCQLVLLREYLDGVDYPKQVKPFPVSAMDRLHFQQDPIHKPVDLYFRGDDSSKDRIYFIDKARKSKSIRGMNRSLKLYRGGEESSEKLSEKQFLQEMASAKICFNFMGNGYACYRYQEPPSVGSVLATKDYPLVTPNDYVDMESCIKFKDFDELKQKCRRVLKSNDLTHSMTANAIEHFKRFHTTEQRFTEFLNYLDAVK